MTNPIINLSGLDFSEFGKGEKFLAARAPVSTRIGGKNLGYSVVRLAPGKRAWPYHAHYVIEEMFFILKGNGTLRHADKEYPVKEGDFICSPPGPDKPHQIINSSDEELMYLAVSTQDRADVVRYPDSEKIGVWCGDAADPGARDNVLAFFKETSASDYWDGESD